MPKQHSLSISIADLLRAGGASEAAIKGLTPAASKLTKGHLVHMWLSQEQETKQRIKADPDLGDLPKHPQLTTADLVSIAHAYENAFNSSAGLAPPQGFLCGWSCCCCTPCCSCCAVAVLEPSVRIA